MKKFGFFMFLFIIMLVFPKGIEASALDAKIYLNGNQLQLSQGVNVENINGTVMVPIRVISENLGYAVGWDKAAQKITVQGGGKTVEMVVGSSSASIDGQRVSMVKAPILRGGTTIIPIRFVSEQMGMNVSWNNQEKAVYLITPESGVSNPGESDHGTLTTIDGISFSSNRLLVAATGTMKPKIMKLTSPDRIVIDVENAAFSEQFSMSNILDATNNGSLTVTGYPDVKSVRYSLYSDNPSTVRIVIDLNYPKNYTLHNEPNGLFTVDLNTSSEPVPAPGAGSKKLVVIDAGHGGHDPGAISVSKKKEKDFALSLALKTAKLLENSSTIDVVLTRSDDTFLELSDRVKIAEKLKADVFISIHANAGPSTASGTETFYQRSSSKSLATVIHKNMLNAVGLKDRGVKYGNFHVIRETTMPATLLEVGFLTNKTDESKLYDPGVQDRVAQSIVNGLNEYFK